MKNRVPGTRIFLACLLLAAFLIRFWGVAFDNPEDPANPDAGFYLRFADCFYRGHLDPHFAATKYHGLLYPYFSLYLMAFAGRIFIFFKYIWCLLAWMAAGRTVPSPVPFSPAERVLVFRTFQVLLSVGLVYLVYRLGKLLWGEREGMIGAALAAFAPQLVNHSRVIQCDVTLAFFTTLTVLFSVRLAREGRLRWYLLAGLTAGMAVGAKHNGILVLMAPLAAHFFGSKPPGLRSWWRGPLLILPAFLAGLFISYPVVWLEPRLFFRRLPEYRTYLKSFDPAPGTFWEQRWFNLLNFGYRIGSQLYGMGPGIFLLGGAGAVLTFLSGRAERRIPAIFALVYCILVLFFRQSVRPKDLLPASLLLCPLAASFITWCVDRLRIRPSLRGIIAATATVLVIVPSLRSDVIVAYFAAAPDTRDLAAEWIEENIPPGSWIAKERYGPPISDGRYRLTKIPFLCYRPLSRYRQPGVDFLVANSGAYQRFFDPFDPCRDENARRFYRSLDRGGALQKSFFTVNYAFINPLIRIYNLKREDASWSRKKLLLRDLDFAYSDSSPRIIILEDDLDYEGKSGFLLLPGEAAERLIVSSRPVPRIGVQIFPGRVPARVKAKVGLQKQSLTLTSPGPVILRFSPRISFPFLRYCYRVQVKALGDSPLLVKLLTSPRHLEEKNAADTGTTRREFSRPSDEGDFDLWFADFFREDPQWWRDKYTRSFEAERLVSPPRPPIADAEAAGGYAVPCIGEGEITECVFGDAGLMIPPSYWTAVIDLKAEGEGVGEAIGELELGKTNGDVLGARALRAAELPPGPCYASIRLPFHNSTLAGGIILTIRSAAGARLLLDRVVFVPDLAAWFHSLGDDGAALPNRGEE
ncbi:MAG: glycosyltransferase family 39 protein [PVC group bacterium]